MSQLKNTPQTRLGKQGWQLLITSCLTCCSLPFLLTTAQPTFAAKAKVVTGGQVLVAKLHHNYPLHIGVGVLNTITLPFPEIIVDTVDQQVQLLSRGSDLLVATSNYSEISLVVRNKQTPDQAITLTLQPKQTPAINVKVVVLSLLAPQFMLNQSELSNADYLLQLSRLMRSTIETIQRKQAIPKASHSSYNLNNFVLTSHYLSPFDVKLSELSLKTRELDQAKNQVLTCMRHQLQIKDLRIFQPQNIYYAGIQLKLLTVANPTTEVIKFNPQACTQPNTMATVLYGVAKQEILPAQEGQILLVEQLQY